MQITFSFSLLVTNYDIHLRKHQPTLSKKFQYPFTPPNWQSFNLFPVGMDKNGDVKYRSQHVCHLVCILYRVPKLTHTKMKNILLCERNMSMENYPLIVITKAKSPDFQSELVS